MLGRGKTGSGKTLAFSIPLVAGLSGGTRRPSKPTGLVLAPTRELATQITAVIEPLAAAVGMTVTTIFGGVSQSRQVSALRAGVDIVVACPGRLEDLMKQRLITLDAVQITVLDEADHMADLGFLPGVTRILAATPAGGQRLLFSATLDNGVDKLVQRFLRNPVTHSVDEIDAPPVAMTHHVFHVSGAQEKTQLVHRLASGTGRRILFMRTKHQARKLAKQLTDAGVPSVDLHGNLSQPARDRNLAAVQLGRRARARRHRHRRARRARRRRRTGRPRRPARRAQGLPAPLGPYGARGQRGRRGDRRAARAAPRHPAAAAQGRHLGTAAAGPRRLGERARTGWRDRPPPASPRPARRLPVRTRRFRPWRLGTRERRSVPGQCRRWSPRRARVAVLVAAADRAVRGRVPAGLRPAPRSYVVGRPCGRSTIVGG